MLPCALTNPNVSVQLEKQRGLTREIIPVSGCFEQVHGGHSVLMLVLSGKTLLQEDTPLED